MLNLFVDAHFLTFFSSLLLQQPPVLSTRLVVVIHSPRTSHLLLPFAVHADALVVVARLGSQEGQLKSGFYGPTCKTFKPSIIILISVF